jgi:hypothetical protein
MSALENGRANIAASTASRSIRTEPYKLIKLFGDTRTVLPNTE